MIKLTVESRSEARTGDDSVETSLITILDTDVEVDNESFQAIMQSHSLYHKVADSEDEPEIVSDSEKEMHKFRDEWDKIGEDMEPDSPGRLVFTQTAMTGRHEGRTRTDTAIECINELIHRIDSLENQLKELSETLPTPCAPPESYNQENDDF